MLPNEMKGSQLTVGRIESDGVKIFLLATGQVWSCFLWIWSGLVRKKMHPRTTLNICH